MPNFLHNSAGLTVRTSNFAPTYAGAQHKSFTSGFHPFDSRLFMNTSASASANGWLVSSQYNVGPSVSISSPASSDSSVGLSASPGRNLKLPSFFDDQHTIMSFWMTASGFSSPSTSTLSHSSSSCTMSNCNAHIGVILLPSPLTYCTILNRASTTSHFPSISPNPPPCEAFAGFILGLGISILLVY